MHEGWRKKRQRAFPRHKTVIPKTFFDYNLPLALAAESLQMVPQGTREDRRDHRNAEQKKSNSDHYTQIPVFPVVPLRLFQRSSSNRSC